MSAGERVDEEGDPTLQGREKAIKRYENRLETLKERGEHVKDVDISVLSETVIDAKATELKRRIEKKKKGGIGEDASPSPSDDSDSSGGSEGSGDASEESDHPGEDPPLDAIEVGDNENGQIGRDPTTSPKSNQSNLWLTLSLFFFLLCAIGVLGFKMKEMQEAIVRLNQSLEEVNDNKLRELLDAKSRLEDAVASLNNTEIGDVLDAQERLTELVHGSNARLEEILLDRVVKETEMKVKESEEVLLTTIRGETNTRVLHLEEALSEKLNQADSRMQQATESMMNLLVVPPKFYRAALLPLDHNYQGAEAALSNPITVEANGNAVVIATAHGPCLSSQEFEFAFKVDGRWVHDFKTPKGTSSVRTGFPFGIAYSHVFEIPTGEHKVQLVAKDAYHIKTDGNGMVTLSLHHTTPPDEGGKKK